MHVYLDHHATTPCLPSVMEAMAPWFVSEYANAGSRSHQMGQRARTAVETARLQVASRLECSPKEVIFTSGATEANNLALLGVVRASPSPRPHVVCSAIEHRAVLGVLEALGRQGVRTTIVPVEVDGRVDPERFLSAIEPTTVVASLMAVNNEVGTVQAIEQVARGCVERGVRFHTDAAQLPCWGASPWKTSPVSMMSVSAHKVYGPKGVGALVVRRGRPKLELEPLQYGGDQERGLRPGTLPVPLIVGMGEAFERLNLGRTNEIRDLRDGMVHALLDLGDIDWNGSVEHRVAGNANLRIGGVDVKALMLACEEVSMSSGSACTSSSLKPSHVLRAMGLTHDAAAQSIRLGLGLHTTAEEVARATSTLIDGIRRVRQLSQSPKGGLL